MDPGKERIEQLSRCKVEGKIKNNSKPEFLYKSRPDDVVIFGPQKTGTTWLQNVLHQIRTKGDETFEKNTDVVWYIQDPQTATINFNAEQIYNPRLFKCHLSYGMLELGKGTKSVYIIRDPYDTMYSFTKFVYRWFGGNTDMDDHSCAKRLLDSYNIPELDPYNYFRNINSWWPHRMDNNVFWLFYEDMKHDLKTIVQQLSEFIAVPLNDVEVNRVCELSSFEHMAANKQQFPPGNIVNLYNQSMGTNDNWTPVSIVRSDGGQIGQGRQNLGPETRAIIERLWSETMKANFGFENYNQLYKSFSRFNNNC